MGDVAKKSGSRQMISPREEMMDETKTCLSPSTYIKDVCLSLFSTIMRSKLFSYILNNHRLTPLEAARILNVPVPYFNSLLDDKTIPHVRKGEQRGIKYRDVMAYKARRDQERSEGLARLAAMGQECKSLTPDQKHQIL